MAWSGRFDSTGSLRHGHQFEHVAVRIPEIHAPAAVPIVELAILQASRTAAIGHPGLLDAIEDGVELAVADVKGVVVALERSLLVEQQRQRFVDTYRREIVDVLVEAQAENVREEAGSVRL